MADQHFKMSKIPFNRNFKRIVMLRDILFLALWLTASSCVFAGKSNKTFLSDDVQTVHGLHLIRNMWGTSLSAKKKKKIACSENVTSIKVYANMN